MDAHRLALSSLITLTLLSPSYCGDDEHFVGVLIPLSVEASKTFLSLSGEVIDLYIAVVKGSSLSATTVNTFLSNLKL